MRLLVCLLACACATAETPPPAVAAAPMRLQPRAFDAKGFADEQGTPADCELAARHLHADNPDQGWAALRACVERARWPRGGFTQLQLLTAGSWDHDLQSRPDAPGLLARVIAQRGGDVEGDLAATQKSRAPIFTLAAALKQPDVYKGRMILLRGALYDLKATTALLRESSLRGTSREVEIGNRSRSEHEATLTSQGDLHAGHHGQSLGTGSAKVTSRSESSTIGRRYENARIETGREALGKLAAADPFLEPDKDFIFLARFEGVQQSAEGANVAVLAIERYFPPSALVVE